MAKTWSRDANIIEPAGRDFEPVSPAVLKQMAARARELRDRGNRNELDPDEQAELVSLTQDSRRL